MVGKSLLKWLELMSCLRNFIKFSIKVFPLLLRRWIYSERGTERFSLYLLKGWMIMKALSLGTSSSWIFMGALNSIRPVNKEIHLTSSICWSTSYSSIRTLWCMSTVKMRAVTWIDWTEHGFWCSFLIRTLLCSVHKSYWFVFSQGQID